MIWAAAALVFLCSLWVAGLVLGRFMAPGLVTAERLKGFVRPVPQMAWRAHTRWSGIPAVDRALDRLNVARHVDRLLDEADAPIKPFEFMLIAAVTALGACVAGLAATHNELIVVPAGLVGAGGPVLWMLVKRSRRREAFNRQLPDALQAIAGALRVGLGLNQGMAIVAADHPYPISAEFSRAQREMNLGLGIDEALMNIAARMRSADFDLALAGMLINRQVGGNLSELLDQVTATIRERVKLKNFIRVLTAQQRISSVIVVAIPPVLMVVLLVGMRAYSSFLLTTAIGHGMLAVSVCMQLLGIYVIRRIGAIEV